MKDEIQASLKSMEKSAECDADMFHHKKRCPLKHQAVNTLCLYELTAICWCKLLIFVYWWPGEMPSCICQVGAFFPAN